MADQAEQLGSAGDILKDPDAAHYIGMSESWLRQTRMAGRTDGTPYHRIGTRAIRYRRRDLDLWLEQRCSASGRVHFETAPSIEQPYQQSARRRKSPMKKRRRRRQRAEGERQ